MTLSQDVSANAMAAISVRMVLVFMVIVLKFMVQKMGSCDIDQKQNADIGVASVLRTHRHRLLGYRL